MSLAPVGVEWVSETGGFVLRVIIVEVLLATVIVALAGATMRFSRRLDAPTRHDVLLICLISILGLRRRFLVNFGFGLRQCVIHVLGIGLVSRTF